MAVSFSFVCYGDANGAVLGVYERRGILIQNDEMFFDDFFRDSYSDSRKLNGGIENAVL